MNAYHSFEVHGAAIKAMAKFVEDNPQAWNYYVLCFNTDGPGHFFLLNSSTEKSMSGSLKDYEERT